MKKQTKQIIEEIKEKVKEYMHQDIFPGHDFNHVTRVRNLAMHIGKIEKGDLGILELACWLHDLGRVKEKELNKSHAEISVEIAKQFFKEVGYSSQKIKDILYAISVHSWKNKAKTKEAQILQDADKLDVMGALGIMRIFGYGGYYHRLEYDSKDPICLNKKKYDDKRYSIDHFYEKIFKLPKLLYTKEAKRIAKNRIFYMKSFLKELYREISGEI
jgi:uncharacterized protein